MSEAWFTGLLPTAGPGITLDAADLFSKFGFGDGDMLDDVADHATVAGMDAEDLYAWEKHPALIWLVREVLLPVCPVGTVLYDIDTIHNPIRCEAWPGWTAGDPDPVADGEVAVEVSWLVVAKVIEHLRTVADVNHIVGQ